MPPGWSPGVYPLSEYFGSLKIWYKLTKLEQEQIGAAIMSRLSGRALSLAKAKVITRIGSSGVAATHKEVDALSLAAEDAAL